MQHVVGNQIPTAIGTWLEVARQDRVGLEEGIESIRQRVDIDSAAQLDCHRSENFVLREDFLTV
ncbi:hypothetical protein I546_6044 [Mycobacterium kansasii 732]|uniref:Uncharacterized protein n=1 Tax=Mycobacterium kansasii TaxID=1768 RepID=A0A1V3XTB4_MYCKA|nr:hypothetical protein I546_6044 [Mycobacterium kansasii 732]OOK82464.1 hypothetical protein BZL30_0681 [Mycobacterium kansasii]